MKKYWILIVVIAIVVIIMVVAIANSKAATANPGTGSFGVAHNNVQAMINRILTSSEYAQWRSGFWNSTGIHDHNKAKQFVYNEAQKYTTPANDGYANYQYPNIDALVTTWHDDGSSESGGIDWGNIAKTVGTIGIGLI